jgi:diguanylate cyclase (GGDEF)-like protein
MSATAAHEQPLAVPDRYRGAQPELVYRCSGAMSIVGSATTLLLMAFYPPTVALGSIGWLLAVPTAVLSIVLGVLSVTVRYRPSIRSVHTSAYIGIAQIVLLQWLAGGGKAPYVQLLMLPMLGSGIGQSVWRCVPVVVFATLAAFSPLLYGGIEVLSTITEFWLLSLLTVLIAIVISSTREHRARLEDEGEHANVLAHVDPLTGMPNRRAFDEALSAAMQSSAADGTSIALLLCDVNSFKQVNDTFGHAAGDEVLRAIARTLSDATRRPDEAFRWAGDEFAVILRDSDESGAGRVAARLRKTIARQCRRPDGTRVTLGTGIAELEPGMSVEEVLLEADRTLFCQKARRAQVRGVA